MGLKEAWVKALRSGDYDQGMGKLRKSDNKFCCLGVLQDLISPEWKPGHQCYRTPCLDLVGCSSGIDGEHTGTICDGNLDLVGLDPEDLNVLMVMNDQYMASFDEIADVIETSERTGQTISDIGAFLIDLFRDLEGEDYE